MAKGLGRTHNLVLGLVLGLALVVGFAVKSHVAASPGDTPTCQFIEQGLGQGFVKGTNSKGDTISIDFIVRGDSNCHKNFVLAAFTIPHQDGNPYPLEDQMLFGASKLENASPGTYKMTVNVPKCFYQVDLALGLNPTGPNGHLPYEPGRLLNAYVGGNGLDCAPNPPPPPPSTGVCSSLDVAFVNKEERTVSAKVNGEVHNAQIIGYKIAWDENNEVSFKQSDTHKYSSNGPFTVVGSVHIKFANGDTKWVSDKNKCVRVVNFKTKTITTPPPTSTPVTTTASSTTTLTDTGAEDIAGIFTAAAIGGALWHKFYFLRKFAKR